MKYLDKINSIEKPNMEIKEKIKKTLDEKNKPINSLGELEKLMIQIGAIKGNENFKLKKKKHFLFASDNGVFEENISPCKKELTKYVSQTMLEGLGAISIMCKTYKIDFTLVDVGIDSDFEKSYKNLKKLKIAKGTKNIKKENAMTRAELDFIFEEIFKLVKENKDTMDICSCGEMGIGNTTTSGAVIYKILGGDIDLVVGRGAGADDTMVLNKKSVILEAAKRINTEDPFEILMSLGGFDIVAMCAFYLACAYYKIPVILDGFISLASALCAYKINPLVREYMIASHKSKEEGINLVYNHLNMNPILHMNMALGEGTGAVLVYPFLECVSPIYKKMLSKKKFEKKYGV